MKRTDLHHELLGLADSLDDSVTPAEASVAISNLGAKVSRLTEFEDET